jgi:hypothetical protein
MSSRHLRRRTKALLERETSCRRISKSRSWVLKKSTNRRLHGQFAAACALLEGTPMRFSMRLIMSNGCFFKADIEPIARQVCFFNRTFLETASTSATERRLDFVPANWNRRVESRPADKHIREMGSVRQLISFHTKACQLRCRQRSNLQEMTRRCVCCPYFPYFNLSILTIALPELPIQSAIGVSTQRRLSCLRQFCR